MDFNGMNTRFMERVWRSVFTLSVILCLLASCGKNAHADEISGTVDSTEECVEIYDEEDLDDDIVETDGYTQDVIVIPGTATPSHPVGGIVYDPPIMETIDVTINDNDPSISTVRRHRSSVTPTHIYSTWIDWIRRILELIRHFRIK